MEPISLILGAAAAGGAAGKLAELFTGYVKDLVRGQNRNAQAAAAENAAQFLTKLSEQLERLEGRLGPDHAVPTVETAMADPDVATTTKNAVIAAARTSSADKHSVLARAVAERIGAAAESPEAVVTNAAVEAIPKLSTAHLSFLGLAAVVYAIRPSIAMPLRAPAPPDAKSKTWNPYTNYVSWIRDALRANALEASFEELYLIHLAAEACILYERKMRKELHRTLYPHVADLYDARTVASIAQDIGEFLHFGAIGRDLRDLWSAGLQHTTLTPIGLLIGTAVYEAKTGQPVSIPWQLADVATGKELEDNIWDGKQIQENFLKALDRAAKDRAERGVGVWRKLDS